MFWWEYVDAEELAMGESERFESKEGAEVWLAEEWEGLLERGIVDVLLFEQEGDHVVRLYRMALDRETPA
jgi:hypothetical protein